ncbi:MAG: transcriptional regulator [Actinomycetota bacterium]
MKISNIWRLLRILLLFSRKTKVKAKEISEDLEISVRQAYRDIECLKLAGIPIYSDKNGFTLLPDFYMPKISLDIPEILTLFLLCSSIKSQKGTPYSDLLSAATDKILNALPDGIKNVFLTSDYEAIVDFGLDTIVDYKKIDEIFKLIYEATIAKKKISLKYYSMGAKKLGKRIVDPYALKFNFGIWYLIGFCHQRNEVRTFRIDRVRKIEILEENFKVPDSFDLDEYFKESWGIIRGQKTKVILKFAKDTADFIAECIWHPSQKLTKNTDGSLIAQFEVGGLSEIKIWILGFGENVEVLEPPELRQELKEAAEKINRIYS